MSTELLLIRHGESEGNVGLPCEADCSLTPKGLEQARVMADRLAKHDLSGYLGLTSPYRRALQTAAEITRVAGLPFAVDEAVRELAGPVTIDGRQFPAETGEQLVERMRKFLRCRQGQKLLVVSHAAPIAVIIQLAQGEKPNTQGLFWQGVENCCPRKLAHVGFLWRH